MDVVDAELDDVAEVDDGPAVAAPMFVYFSKG